MASNRKRSRGRIKAGLKRGANVDTEISASDSLITNSMHIALEAAPAMDRGEKELFLGTHKSKTRFATWVDSPWLLVAKSY